jgi:predicted RNA binding protein YcfA (HicA-like mRNA interferase family)
MMSSAEVIRRIKADGWFHVKTVGDHHHYRHAVKPGKTTVPHPVKDVPLFVLKYIEKQTGLKLR